jgi:type IV pilus assembly protein PilA
MTQICAVCGNRVETGDKFCRLCGRQLNPMPANVTTPAGAALPGEPETSSKAVISLVCGLLFFVPLAFVAAIVFGHLGLSEIRRSAGRLKGEGIAIAGLVLGYLWIAGIPITLILAAIAIPNLLRARIAANEISATAAVRTITAAETSYAAAHTDEGYTCSLSSLQQTGLISRRVANGQRNGYVFELSGCAPGAEGTANSKYQVVAYPLQLHQTGVRSFCADESAVLKVDAEGSPQHCLEAGTQLP